MIIEDSENNNWIDAEYLPSCQTEKIMMDTRLHNRCCRPLIITDEGAERLVEIEKQSSGPQRGNSRCAKEQVEKVGKRESKKTLLKQKLRELSRESVE